MPNEYSDPDYDWEEEEEDYRAIYGESSRFLTRDKAKNPKCDPSLRDRSKSPIDKRIRSAVTLADSAIEARIEQALDEKLNRFMETIQDSVARSSNTRIGEEVFTGQMEEIMKTQKKIQRNQSGAKIKGEGTRYQYLSLYDVRSDIESAEKIVGKGIANNYSLTPSEMIDLARQLQEAHNRISTRLDLLKRADALPNGFRVLTAFQRKAEESESPIPEIEKSWAEALKLTEKEKEPAPKKHRNGDFCQLMFYLSDPVFVMISLDPIV